MIKNFFLISGFLGLMAITFLARPSTRAEADPAPPVLDTQTEDTTSVPLENLNPSQNSQKTKTESVNSQTSAAANNQSDIQNMSQEQTILPSQTNYSVGSIGDDDDEDGNERESEHESEIEDD